MPRWRYIVVIFSETVKTYDSEDIRLGPRDDYFNRNRNGILKFHLVEWLEIYAKVLLMKSTCSLISCAWISSENAVREENTYIMTKFHLICSWNSCLITPTVPEANRFMEQESGTVRPTYRWETNKVRTAASFYNAPRN